MIPFRLLVPAPWMVGSLVRAHMDAFPDAMSTRLGKWYLQRFFRWFMEDGDTITLVAVDDEILVGYVVGAPLGYHRRLNRELAPTVALALVRRPWLVLAQDIRRQLWRRVKMSGANSLEDDDGPLSSPCYSLVGIGVSPKAQGRGAGRRLLVAFEHEARGRGAKALRLSVNPNNGQARRLYERLGWRSVGDPQPGSLYYTKPLVRTNAGSVVARPPGDEAHG